MKYTLLLALACTVLARAVEPISGEQDGHDTLQNINLNANVKDENPENTPVIASKTQRASYSLQKRLDGIDVPNTPNPTSLVIAGVTFTWIMARSGSHWVAKKLSILNRNTRPVAVSILAHGTKIIENQGFGQDRIFQISAPAGGFGDEVSIVVQKS